MKIIIKACFYTCLFFSPQIFSKIILDDHYTTGFKPYSWKEVCQKLTKRDSPLIEAYGVSQLDCMGQKVMVGKFCNKAEMSNPYYTRGKVDKDSKEVRCYSAKRVVIKWQCEGKEDPYCKDKDVGCFLFKEKLATRLKLAHSSLEDSNILNCYFDTQVNDLHLNI